MAFWRTKAAISLKRVKMEEMEKLLWGPPQRSFEQYHSRPPMASPSSRLGVCNLSQERVKLRTSNFIGTFTGSIGTKGHENVRNSSRGHSQRVPKIFRAPMYVYRAHCAVIFAIAQLSCIVMGTVFRLRLFPTGNDHVAALARGLRYSRLV